MKEKYSIGEVAKMLQVSTRTLRFYDEKDLIKSAFVENNGYRFYKIEQIKQLELIIYLKNLGFSLKQIKHLLKDESGDQSLELLLNEQYQENKQKIAEINQQQKQIEHLRKIKLSRTSLTNFSDITNIMKKESKLMTLRKRMWLLTILLMIIELVVISILYAFQLRMSIIVILLVLIGGVALSKYYYDNVEYVCPNCGKEFTPSFVSFNIASHTPKFRKLTCSKCGKKSYCLEISRRK